MPRPESLWASGYLKSVLARRRSALLSRRGVVDALPDGLVHLLRGEQDPGPDLKRPASTYCQGDGCEAHVVGQVDNAVDVVFTQGEVERLQCPALVLDQLLYHSASF